MPQISAFYGIVIYMYFGDHGVPHFHAKYQKYDASFAIGSKRKLAGDFPKRAQKMVIEWAEKHEKELLADWELCLKNKTPKPIQPLV